MPRCGRARALVVALCASLFALCTPSHAQQQPQRIYKIGRLAAGSPSDPLSQAAYPAFQDGLRELGWIEGTNLVIENRWVTDPQSARRLAVELAQLKVEVIVAVGSPLVQAAKQATDKIPIVMSGTGADPVTAGFIDSLQKPGGNITGLSMLSTELNGKRLELLRDIVQNPARAAILSNPEFPAVAIQLKETQVAATSLGIQLESWEVRAASQIPNAFAAMKQAGVSGLIVFSDPVTLERNRGTILSLALKHRIPTVYPWPNYVEEGGLASYSANLLDMHRRAATYVDRILKGAKPAEVPVEQPRKFEMIVNLKSARQIGLAMPPHVLARADRVIR